MISHEDIDAGEVFDWGRASELLHSGPQRCVISHKR